MRESEVNQVMLQKNSLNLCLTIESTSQQYNYNYNLARSMPTRDFGRFLLLHSRDTWPPLLLQVSLLLTMITSDFWDQQPIAEQAHVVY